MINNVYCVLLTKYVLHSTHMYAIVFNLTFYIHLNYELIVL